MSPSPYTKARRDIGFPRVSGDEPWLKGKTETMGAFSPRERG